MFEYSDLSLQCFCKCAIMSCRNYSCPPTTFKCLLWFPFINTCVWMHLSVLCITLHSSQLPRGWQLFSSVWPVHPAVRQTGRRNRWGVGVMAPDRRIALLIDAGLCAHLSASAALTGVCCTVMCDQKKRAPTALIIILPNSPSLPPHSHANINWTESDLTPDKHWTKSTAHGMRGE